LQRGILPDGGSPSREDCKTMTLKALREQVVEANLELVRRGLVIYKMEAQERTVTSLGSRPLLVLSATEPADAERLAWNNYSEGLASQSSAGVHEIFDGASHTSFSYDADYAARTVATIERMIEAVRTD
jgi:hypothetical protein